MKSSPYEPASETKGIPWRHWFDWWDYHPDPGARRWPRCIYKQNKVILVECAGNRKASIHKLYNWIEIDNTLYSSHSDTYLLPLLVCDNNMVFTNVLGGWPGSVHDSRVLRNYELFGTVVNKFPGDTHLLGDGGYPLLRYASVNSTPYSTFLEFI